MPIYEYQCQKCNEVFEVLQKHDDPAPSKHSCGSKRVKRLMSRTSFVLKGEGWYITDYSRKDAEAKEKRKKKPTSEGGDSGSDSKSDSTSDGKSDSSDGGDKKSKSKGKGKSTKASAA